MSVKLVERGGSERYRDFRKSAEGSDLYRSKEKRWPISLLGEGFPEHYALVFRLPFCYRFFFFFLNWTLTRVTNMQKRKK